MILRNTKDPEILLITEGTYPYVRGGVSSWINQLIQNIPERRFGVIFIGSDPSHYGEPKYTYPDNLVYLETHYIFESSQSNPSATQKRSMKREFIEEIQALHAWISAPEKNSMPASLKDLSFFTKKITYEDFLYSEEAWHYINETYMKHCPDIPFLDYFWTLRSIHTPLWKLADIARTLPDARLIHTPSTGYAGLLSALTSMFRDRPMVLTEHGIYTKERKIDLLTADWITYHKPTLLKEPEEENYIKKMWVNFFERIGRVCYNQANPIISLYHEARQMQVLFGAPEEKTRIIPNGIDVDTFTPLISQNPPSPVITLIGRVVSIKDIKTFIRAMRITVTKIPETQGWIVGPTDENPDYYTECLHMVEALGLEKNVKFLGFRNICDILPQTRLLTLTSISEGMPLVILEGFAAGLPCVATDVGSCRELIEGGLNEEDRNIGAAGAIVPIANPQALSDAYISYIKEDTLWREARERGLRRVKRFYRQESVFRTYDEIYSSLIKKESSET